MQINIVMLEIRLGDIFYNHDSVDAYRFFQEIECWCSDNLSHSSAKFDYSSTICVYGVDIPGKIIFNNKESLEKFNLIFNRKEP